jgi:hypothetical protein
MMIEGSGAGSIPLTSGSGSGRPKNMWIQWIRIPILNTEDRNEFMHRAGIFKKSMGARHRVGIGFLYPVPPGYTGWRNSFLGINAGAL